MSNKDDMNNQDQAMKEAVALASVIPKSIEEILQEKRDALNELKEGNVWPTVRAGMETALRKGVEDHGKVPTAFLPYMDDPGPTMIFHAGPQTEHRMTLIGRPLIMIRLPLSTSALVALMGAADAACPGCVLGPAPAGYMSLIEAPKTPTP